MGVANDKGYTLTLGTFPAKLDVCWDSDTATVTVPVTYAPANLTTMTWPYGTQTGLSLPPGTSGASCKALATNSTSAKSFNCTKLPVGKTTVTIKTRDEDAGARDCCCWRCSAAACLLCCPLDKSC